MLVETALAAKDYEDVSERARGATSYLQRAGTLHDLARLGNVAGYAAIAAKRYEEAVGWLGQGLDAARRLRRPWMEFTIQNNRGLARLWLDRLDDAEQDLAAALSLCRIAGAEQLVSETLLGVAALAARRGDLERAARLAGAAHGLDTEGTSFDEERVWQRLHEEFIAPASDRLGQGRWDALERDGTSLTCGEAIDLALESAGAHDHTVG